MEGFENSFINSSDFGGTENSWMNGFAKIETPYLK